MGMYYDLYAVTDAEAQNLLDDPEAIHTFLETHDAGNNVSTSLSLDKSWHGIHFGLTRTAWEGEKPLNFLMAGQTVGDIDIGYGPARVLFSDDIQHIENALAEFTDIDFEQNFIQQRWGKPKFTLKFGVSRAKIYLLSINRFFKL